MLLIRFIDLLTSSTAATGINKGDVLLAALSSTISVLCGVCSNHSGLQLHVPANEYSLTESLAKMLSNKCAWTPWRRVDTAQGCSNPASCLHVPGLRKQDIHYHLYGGVKEWEVHSFSLEGVALEMVGKQEVKINHLRC